MSEKEKTITDLEDIISELKSEVEKQKDLAEHWEKKCQKLYDVIDCAVYDLKKAL